MGDGSEPTADIVELGVVDPLRMPSWLRGRLDRVPLLGRVFAGLALIDVVARALGLVGPPIALTIDYPLASISSVVPRELWILLPAIILTRRTDAVRTIPWVVRGAVLLALTTLFITPLLGLGTTLSPSLPVITVVASAAISIAATIAWLMLARGLAAIRPRPATPAAARLAALVAGAIVASMASAVIVLWTSPKVEVFGGSDPFAEILDVLALLGSLASGYLWWIVVRGFGDADRPFGATLVAAAAGSMWAIATLAGVLGMGFFLLAQPEFDGLTGFQASDVLSTIGWLAVAVAPSLLVGAFALGLADPDMPPEAASTR